MIQLAGVPALCVLAGLVLIGGYFILNALGAQSIADCKNRGQLPLALALLVMLLSAVFFAWALIHVVHDNIDLGAVTFLIAGIAGLVRVRKLDNEDYDDDKCTGIVLSVSCAFVTLNYLGGIGIFILDIAEVPFLILYFVAGAILWATLSVCAYKFKTESRFIVIP